MTPEQAQALWGVVTDDPESFSSSIIVLNGRNLNGTHEISNFLKEWSDAYAQFHRNAMDAFSKEQERYGL